MQTSPPLFIVLTHFFSSQVVVPNIGLKACALLAARTNYNQCADVPKSHNPPPFFFFFSVGRSHKWIFLSAPGDTSFHFSHVKLGVFLKGPADICSVFWGDHGMSDQLHPRSSRPKQVLKGKPWCFFNPYQVCFVPTWWRERNWKLNLNRRKVKENFKF